MKKVFFSILMLLPLATFPAESLAQKVSVRQGDIVKIEVEKDCNKTHITIPKLGSYPIFTLEKKKTLILPVDITGKIGTFQIPSCGTGTSTKTLSIIARKKPIKEFIIPKEEGGNTLANANKVKNDLASDARIFMKAYSNKKQLWTEPFRFPLKEKVVTDVYGYSRNSQGINVLHKGLDVKASVGTTLYAMNRGVVRYIGSLPTYGKVIILDHGMGIQTVYLHLSVISVKVGQLVEKGKILGETGDTGFTGGPHLHISTRVSGVSVDPEVFLKVLGETKPE